MVGRADVCCHVGRPERGKAGRGRTCIGRVDVSEPASISSGIAARYATAIFELAKDDNALTALEADLDGLSAVLADSADFRSLILSPVHPRSEQEAAIRAIAEKMGLQATMGNALALMAQNRRLFVLPQLLAALRNMIADDRGEVTAEVTSAQALSDAQASALAEALKAKTGSDVKINATVDESLIGGLVVRLGSKMIDTSIRSKLSALQNTMKEVG